MSLRIGWSSKEGKQDLSAMDFLKGLVDSKKRGLEGPQEASGAKKKWKRRGDDAKAAAAEEAKRLAEVNNGI